MATPHPISASLPRVVLPRTVRDLGPVDIGPFLALADRFSERYWEAENASKDNNYEVFHHTQHVILRFLENADDAWSSYSRPAWTVVAPALEAELLRIVEPYGFADPHFPKAMFARLAAGAEIDRHRDEAAANYVTHKIHVPLRSHPDVQFEVHGEFFHLAPGRAYEVNNVRPHGVRNPSPLPRLHFIFEVFDGAAGREEP